MLTPHFSSLPMLHGLLLKDASMLNSSASFWRGERPSHRHFMAEFPVSFLGLPPQAIILRSVMTTMRNCEAKPLLEAICPTHKPRTTHSPTDATICACWIRRSLIRNIFQTKQTVAWMSPVTALFSAQRVSSLPPAPSDSSTHVGPFKN